MIEGLEAGFRDLEDVMLAHEATLARNGGAGEYSDTANRIGLELQKVEDLIDVVGKDTFGITLWPTFVVGRSPPAK